MEKVIDFDSYGLDPTYWVNEILKSNLLHEDYIVTNYLYIVKNLYDNLDHWWPFTNRFEGSFYKIGKIKERPKYGKLEPKQLYVTGIFEFGEIFINSKEVYTLIDCLGDMGGLIGIIV